MRMRAQNENTINVVEPLCLFCVYKSLICVQGTNKSHRKNNSTNEITYKMVKSNNNDDDDGCYSGRAAPPHHHNPPTEQVYIVPMRQQNSSFLLKFCRLHN